MQCPECSAQFVVADDAIPPAGRKVRCTSCKHVWHAEPEAPLAADLSGDSESVAADDGIDPNMLQSLADLPSEEDDDGLSDEDNDDSRSDDDLAAFRNAFQDRSETDSESDNTTPIKEFATFTGVGLGLALAGFWALGPSIGPSLPALSGALTVVGRMPAVAGQNLTLSGITASFIADSNIISIEGRIDNDTETGDVIPEMMVTVWDAQNTPVIDTTLPAPQQRLSKNSSTIFSHDLDWPSTQKVTPQRVLVTFQAPDYLK